MEKFVVTIVLAAIIPAILCSVIEPKCSANQVFNFCKTACPDYCHRGSVPDPCTKQCVIGCECAPGYIRRYIDSDECIPETSCNRAAKKCGRNKTYYTCGSACPEYCGQPDDVPCTKNCVQECQCKPGYVLSNKNSAHCIPVGECP